VKTVVCFICSGAASKKLWLFVYSYVIFSVSSSYVLLNGRMQNTSRSFSPVNAPSLRHDFDPSIFFTGPFIITTLKPVRQTIFSSFFVKG
jgi:hypothetical protein